MDSRSSACRKSLHCAHAACRLVRGQQRGLTHCVPDECWWVLLQGKRAGAGQGGIAKKARVDGEALLLLLLLIATSQISWLPPHS